MIGWYSAYDHTEYPRVSKGKFRWRPYLDFDNGAVHSTLAVNAWFESKRECDQFIKDHIVSAGANV